MLWDFKMRPGRDNRLPRGKLNKSLLGYFNRLMHGQYALYVFRRKKLQIE
jgi:hypothetical protein